MRLDDVILKLSSLSAEERNALERDAIEVTKKQRWIPNPGPQTDAFFTEADEVFYGGQAGGGKSDLLLGLSVTEHQNSLVLRRLNKDAVKLVKRLEEIVGHRDGYNGSLQMWRMREGEYRRQIDFSGCEQESDKQKFKGDPHDLIAYDELPDFLESQFRFINGWNRSVNPKQRCRVVAAGNPPTTSDGLWIIKYWGPWLDPNHSNPAKPGELRWYTTIEGKDQEVDGPGPHGIEGERKLIRARSRTFIPATLDDNPDLAATNYDSVLAALPEELRRAYRDGRFDAALADQPFQLMPTAWIVAAQERWHPDGHKQSVMTAMALDPAGGGKDSACISYRHGGWYGHLKDWQGKATLEAEQTVANLILLRKHNAPIIVDVGGGYAGSTTLRLKDNGIPFIAFNGAEESHMRPKGAMGKLKFANKRAAAYWKFREELDPDQEGGSAIALPPDTELRADLAAMTWEPKLRGITMVSKEIIREKIGRSPGKGDAVVMCLTEGEKAAIKFGSAARIPKVVLGHQANHSLLRR